MNLFNIIITLLVSLFFSMILIGKIKAGLVLSFVFFVIPIYWIVSKKVNEKQFLLIFFIFYPLLPYIAGINLGEGIPVLRAHRVAALLLLFFFASNGLLLKYYKDFLKSNVFSFNIIILIASMIVTSFFSTNMQGTLFFTISMILELFIFTVVIFSVFKTDSDIEQLINAILISCAILCVFGIIEKSSGYNFYSKFGVFDDNLSSALTLQIRDGSVRVQGPFDHSISYSAYIVTILPLFLYRFKRHFKYFNLSVLLVMSALFASQSRAGILGAGIIFLLYYILIERKNMILIIVLSIPIIIYNASDITRYLANLNPFTTTSSEMSSSTMARGIQFLFMIEQIKQNILFGFGMVAPKIRSVDNFYLLFAYQYGIVGLTSYLLLLITVLIKPFKVFGVELFKEELLLAFLFSIIAFFIINALVALWSYHFIYYIYIGLIARLIVNRRRGVDA